MERKTEKKRERGGRGERERGRISKGSSVEDLSVEDL